MEQIEIFGCNYLATFIADYRFIANGTCQDSKCNELNIQECKRYGKLNAMEFTPVNMNVSRLDGAPLPDHCFAKEGSQLYFNQRITGNNASLSRKKLCVCRGLSKGIQIQNIILIISSRHIQISSIVYVHLFYLHRQGQPSCNQKQYLNQTS